MPYSLINPSCSELLNKSPILSLFHSKGEQRWVIRYRAQQWVEKNHLADVQNKFNASKYHSSIDGWFFTLPISYFDPNKSGDLNIFLEYENKVDFNLLKVLFAFFIENENKFDIRESGTKKIFDLHISAKKRNWLCCERGQGINFSEFEL